VAMRIFKGLERYEFIEELINMIIVTTKDSQAIDTEKIINLLCDLDRLRLELEYR
jgi:hypothetical protein